MKMLTESGLNFHVITKEPKKNLIKIWFFCMINGIKPIKIFTSKYLFKKCNYSYREAILKIQADTRQHVILIHDDETDKDLLRDLKNVTLQTHKNFKQFAEQKRIKSIKPFT
jgi:hypothetical protein